MSNYIFEKILGNKVPDQFFSIKIPGKSATAPGLPELSP